jgi:hypothetical protein
LAKTHDYQLIHDTESEIEAKLAAQADGGWRPILMSTATVKHGPGAGFYRFRESDSVSLP